MKILLLFISILLMVAQVSCKDQKPQEKSDIIDSSIYKKDFELFFYLNPENTKAIELNSQAASLIEESEFSINLSKKDSLLTKAENILKMVINEKNNFYRAYISLAIVYIRKKNYRQAEVVLTNLIKIIEYPDAVFYLGILLEKQNDKKNAEENYKRALILYNDYLTTHMARTNDELNREVVVLLLAGKEYSLKRFDEQLKENPDNTPLLEKDFIQNFDRDKFIQEF